MTKNKDLAERAKQVRENLAKELDRLNQPVAAIERHDYPPDFVPDTQGLDWWGNKSVVPF